MQCTVNIIGAVSWNIPIRYDFYLVPKVFPMQKNQNEINFEVVVTNPILFFMGITNAYATFDHNNFVFLGIEKVLFTNLHE